MLPNSLEKSPGFQGTRSWAGELSTSTPPTFSPRQSPPLPAWVLWGLLCGWAHPPHSFALACVKHDLCFLKSYLLESASSKKPPQMYRTHDDQPRPEFSPSAGHYIYPSSWEQARLRSLPTTQHSAPAGKSSNPPQGEERPRSTFRASPHRCPQTGHLAKSQPDLMVHSKTLDKIGSSLGLCSS